MPKSVTGWTPKLSTAGNLAPGDHFKWRTSQKGVVEAKKITRQAGSMVQVNTHDGAERTVPSSHALVLYVPPK